VANNYPDDTKCCGPEMLTLMEDNEMIRKGLIYLATSLMILLLVSLAIAVIPPPPANQNIGLYDTVFTGFSTEECKNIDCHGDENIPNRHHLLIDSEGYVCLDCHKINDGVFEPFRNCSDCHEVSPHHITDDAQNLECSSCHGSLVDDYNDGHVIPTYEKSLITPDSSYKAINSTTGLKIGGCEACHEPDLSADPEIRSNPNTHHNLTGFSTYNCNLCHQSDYSTGTPGEGEVGLDIRNCERCHGIKSLHNIQYDYDNTVGDRGYGHIGDNWDCFGCHGWVSSQSEFTAAVLAEETFSTLAGGMEPTPVPIMDTFDPREITVGQETVITISGGNFIYVDNDGVTHEAKVVLSNDLMDEDLVFEPDSITATEIVVTIPGTIESGNYDLWVVMDGDERTKKEPLTVVPELLGFTKIDLG
jgi:hypothetical protein